MSPLSVLQRVCVLHYDLPIYHRVSEGIDHLGGVQPIEGMSTVMQCHSCDLTPRPSHFSRTILKGWEWPGDEANCAQFPFLKVHVATCFNGSLEYIFIRRGPPFPQW